jgi:short-subunit dehydrogenase
VIRSFRSILITGASGGLGAALARHYAAPGVRLALGARHAERLAVTADVCRAAGAEVSAEIVDVTDTSATCRWVLSEDERRPIELAIANAGISGEAGAIGSDPALAVRIYTVNVLGVLNTIEPLLPRMSARRVGQAGIVASLAGFRGMPRGPAYSGSKAALIVHGEAWRARLAGTGVGVSVICPGYIRTPMVARHHFTMPFLMEPDAAAHRIAAGLAQNQARIIFPWQLRVAAWMFRALPESWTRRLIPASPYEAAVSP